jgi:hypothetical protein
LVIHQTSLAQSQGTFSGNLREYILIDEGTKSLLSSTERRSYSKLLRGERCFVCLFVFGLDTEIGSKLGGI